MDGFANSEVCPVVSDTERIAMLRSLDPDIALAYYAANNLGGPTNNARDKTIVRLHKERIACGDLTEDERDVSRQWLADRARQRQR